MGNRDEKFMYLALEQALEGVGKGQSPFGACIVRGDEVIACTYNEVRAKVDPTAHAEVQAISLATQKLKTIDLSDCEIYSTTEPCPMCFSACHWAGIRRIVYGASIKDSEKVGFRELTISNQEMKKTGGANVEIVGGVLLDENIKLLKKWQKELANPY